MGLDFIFFIFDPSDMWVNIIQKLGGCVFFGLTLDLSRGAGHNTNFRKKQEFSITNVTILFVQILWKLKIRGTHCKNNERIYNFFEKTSTEKSRTKLPQKLTLVQQK